MLYPRYSDKDELVTSDQMVGYKEHLTHTKRILCLSGDIGFSADPLDLLMALDTLSDDPITLFISSGGGSLDTTFLLYDTLKMMKSPIITVGRYAASAAALILAAGCNRYLLPHAKVMLHLPAGQMQGDSADFDIQHKQMNSYKEKVVDLLQECGVKKNREEILGDINRDFWLEPQEAIDYGLADEILTPEKWQEWRV